MKDILPYILPSMPKGEIVGDMAITEDWRRWLRLSLMAIGYGAVKTAGTRMLKHDCSNMNAGTRLLEHKCWNTTAGTRMLEHDCWNTSAKSQMLRRRCWNTTAGSQMLKQNCRITDDETQMLEHSVTWGGMRRGGRVKSQFRKSERTLAWEKQKNE